MKMRHSVKWMLMGALVVPHLTACSFGGEGEEEEVEASEEGNAADVGEEGNVSEEGNNVAVEGAEGNMANGAEGNVAFEDANANAMPGMEGAEGTASNDIPPELLNTQNETAGAEGMPVTDATAEAAPMDAVPAEGNTAAAAPAPVAASGDARVYFVNVDSASIHSGADASSSSVGTVSKGDPVLVTIEGNWANVANRGYIEVANLSQAPVGRTISSKSWR